jgi:hypothetical protein
MSNASSAARTSGQVFAIAMSSKALVTMTLLMMILLMMILGMQAAHASVGSAKALEGMWCSDDAGAGETIVQYSAAGSDITAFTVLFEADPRRIGSQSSMRVTMEAPNVFVRRGFGGIAEEFSVDSGRLTVSSLRIWNSGTGQETREVLATRTFHKCDTGQAFRRAHEFLSSPRAEQATRLALLRDAEAELQARRNSSKDAYYEALIRQLSLARQVR